MARSKIIDDKSQIIDLAQRLIDEEGIEAVSMRRLSKEMGVSSMTLYNYVHNADDVLREVLVRAFGELNEQVLSMMNGLVRSGIPGHIAYAKAYATALYELSLKRPALCSYLISQGRTTFFNDAELRPFYDPFGRLALGLTEDEKQEMTRVFAMYQYVVHSMLLEMNTGMRAISRGEYMETVELFLTKMFAPRP